MCAQKHSPLPCAGSVWPPPSWSPDHCSSDPSTPVSHNPPESRRDTHKNSELTSTNMKTLSGPNTQNQNRNVIRMGLTLITNFLERSRCWKRRIAVVGLNVKSDDYKICVLFCLSTGWMSLQPLGLWLSNWLSRLVPTVKWSNSISASCKLPDHDATATFANSRAECGYVI